MNDFLEQTLEEIIFENKAVIHTRGLLRLKHKTFRQVVLPSGKKMDLFSFEITAGCLNCDIYELKREIINADAICQAYGYFKELKCLTKNYFQCLDARIIMVGKRYEPVSILDALPVPYRVYTYTYKIDGILFKEIENPYVCFPPPNENFSYGLWAFGNDRLFFTDQSRTVNFHSAFESYSLKKIEFKITIKDLIDIWVKDPETLELPEEITEQLEQLPLKPKVYTEIFPEQPRWSKEFANNIPICDTIEEEIELESDLQEYDYEPEEEGDWSDFEPDADYEYTPININYESTY